MAYGPSPLLLALCFSLALLWQAPECPLMPHARPSDPRCPCPLPAAAAPSNSQYNSQCNSQCNSRIYQKSPMSQFRASWNAWIGLIFWLLRTASSAERHHLVLFSSKGFQVVVTTEPPLQFIRLAS
jgi:hypothetical protein